MIFWEVCRNWDTPVQGFRPPGHCRPRGVWSATEASQACPSPASRPESGDAHTGPGCRPGLNPQLQSTSSLARSGLFPAGVLGRDTESWLVVPSSHHSQAAGAPVASGTVAPPRGHSEHCSYHHLGPATGLPGRPADAALMGTPHTEATIIWSPERSLLRKVSPWQVSSEGAKNGDRARPPG